VDQLIMVEIVTEDEFTHFNFQFPTNKVAGEASVSGTEAVFQILRQVCTFFHTCIEGGWCDVTAVALLSFLKSQMHFFVKNCFGLLQF